MSSIPPDPQAPHGARDASDRPAPVSADALLPPIEPPTAGFLIQLFVVPAVIVAAVVLLWFVIESLARTGEQDPDAILQGLRSNQGFQAANDLANMLNVPERFPDLTTNAELARKLGDFLTELVQAGDEDDAAVRMRYVLVSALGRIQVIDGLPALLLAARRDPELQVRRKAAHDVAVLGSTLAELNPPKHLAGAEVVDGLVELSLDEDELVRSWSAVAIGWAGAAPEADARLVESLALLADDPYTDARFNAAVALARIGSPSAPAAVAEMLDLDAIAASVSVEKADTADPTEKWLPRQQAFKREAVLYSALQAIDWLLAQSKSGAALAPVEKALAAFIAKAPKVQDPAPVARELIDAARETLERVKAAGS